jgi:uridine kinase
MSNTNAPILIGIAGPSGSGKSLLVDNLHQTLHDQYSVSIIREDSYYRDQAHIDPVDRPKKNYDHPDALEHDLLVTHLKSLKEKNSVDVPIYKFHTHTRSEETQYVAPAQVILCDGILLLADKNIREQLDITVFIDAPLDICLIRRLNRDLSERGRSIQNTLDQYVQTVRPMYWEFIAPSKEGVNHIVTGGGKNWEAIETIKRDIVAKIEQINQGV